ncbi:MAG: delta-lactam-biosynthetic de-N-acetylase [Pelotomaculum sp.]
MRVAKNTRRFISICIVIFFALAGAAGCAVTEKTNPAGLNDITGDKAFVEQQESENGTVPAVVDGDNDEAGAGDNQAEGEVPATPTEPKPEPAPAGSTIDPSGLSNAKKGWGLKRNDQHQQPEMPASISAELSKYGAYWIGNPDEKAVYLTFDEGYENGYTGRILDILKANDVKAAFFVTGHYLESQPALVKRMVEEGHIVGNHTDSHPSLPDISDEKIKQELLAVEQAYEEITGQKGMRYLRPPMGEYSQRTLALTNSLGYHNILWSLAYVDWVPMPGGPDEAYSSVMNNIHNGALILMHAVSQDNTEALDRILKDIKGQGYVFKTLDDLTGN